MLLTWINCQWLIIKYLGNCKICFFVPLCLNCVTVLIYCHYINCMYYKYCYWFLPTTLCVSAVFAVVRCLSDVPSVCPSRSCQIAEDIVKLLSRPGSPIILALRPRAPVPNSKGNPSSGALNTRGGKNWRFSTEFAVYLGKGTIWAHGWYGTLIGCQVADWSVSVPMTLSDLERRDARSKNFFMQVSLKRLVAFDLERPNLAR